MVPLASLPTFSIPESFFVPERLIIESCSNDHVVSFILIQLQKGRNAIYSCSPSQYATNRPHNKHFFF